MPWRVETGVDITEVERVRAALERWGERFENRVFTEAERAYCRSKRFPWINYAARFAAKEAAMKALGTGWNGVHWKEIEVVREPSGKPNLRFHGRALERFQRMGGVGARLSLSHTDQLAIAYVLLLFE
ncbi:MAG: holo-[acyl-carrier-protein] synthase [Candidatus Poribacteria bacterium]|nr:MAG: holo-[acyl-carrier-protein] synthase [Candidatus Poribacteria bacterium]